MRRKAISIVLAAALLLTMGLVTTLPVGAATEEEIQDSIELGIAWLASVQNGDGSWGSAERIGTTGLVLVKLEDRAFELGFDGPFDPAYPFDGNVTAGLDFLFQYANTMAISLQIAGDPDSNGNGLGVSIYDETYYTGILMMAVAAGRDPSRVVATGPLTGWTYGDVLQDLTDWMAYAQSDTGNSRGGWYYDSVNGGSGADQSNSGYGMLGLLYAQAPLYGYESNIPGFVATELNYWIDYIQNDVDGDDYDGGSGYGDPDNWVNSLKTGNLLTQMAFVGDTLSDTRVQDALNYTARHWEDDWVQGWGKSGPVQYQATYCLMKGFEAMGVPLDGVPGVADWYQDMADAIVAEQNVAGYWPSSPAYVWPGGSLGWMADPELSTAWALLTLERIAPPPPTEMAVKVTGGGTVDWAERVTYGFTAQRDASGVVKGEAEFHHRDVGFRDHADVLYLAVSDTDAWIGAVITQSDDPALVGQEIYFRVQDNGEGKKATGPDGVSTVVFGPAITALSRPALGLMPWTNGNVQIHVK